MLDRKSIKRIPRELRWRLGTQRSITRHLSGRLGLGKSSWLFLLGVNNSGTTVIARLIGGHDRICNMVPEGQHVTSVFPLAWQLGISRLWTERLDLFRWTEDDDPTPALRAKYDWSYYLEPNQYLFEKSPPDTIRSRWLQKNFTPARFLGSVRHPYAVAEGIRRREGCSIQRAAQHWMTANEIMLEDAEHLDHFKIVRYEDICERPLEVLEETRQFLELAEPYQPDIVNREFSIHNAGNYTQPLSNMNSGSFTRLTSEDVRQINEIVGATMQRFGYQTEDPGTFAARPPSHEGQSSSR